MSFLYQTLFFRPILNLLIYLYETVAFRNLGIAIILCTILIRLVLYPLFQKSAEHQTVMQAMQPKIKKIQEEHKHDREKQGEAMMALFQEHQVNPFSGFLLLLIQLPIMIALYQIILRILHPDILNHLYAFVPRPDHINATFFGLLNLANSNIVMVVLATAGQFLQTWFAVRAGSQGKLTSQQVTTLLMAPGMMLVIFYLLHLPNAVMLYWLTTSLFSMIQQIFINRKLQHGKLGNIS